MLPTVAAWVHAVAVADVAETAALLQAVAVNVTSSRLIAPYLFWQYPPSLSYCLVLELLPGPLLQLTLRQSFRLFGIPGSQQLLQVLVSSEVSSFSSEFPNVLRSFQSNSDFWTVFRSFSISLWVLKCLLFLHYPISLPLNCYRLHPNITGKIDVHLEFSS